MDARLTETCVQRGGSQGLTVQTLPRAVVGFDSYYSDGKDGGALGGNYGGNAGGQTDASGRYEATWVVSPTAPSGPVTVIVVASHARGTVTKSLRFVVAKGTC
jgi:hypothetical protein